MVFVYNCYTITHDVQVDLVNAMMSLCTHSVALVIGKSFAMYLLRSSLEPDEEPDDLEVV